MSDGIKLRTAAAIAAELQRTLDYDTRGVNLVTRVAYVLRTRQHIRPFARAGSIRLYGDEAVAYVRQELNGIAANKGEGRKPRRRRQRVERPMEATLWTA